MNNNISIKNNFNKTISKSQQRWLDEFTSRYGDRIIDVALTRAGFISVDFKRLSPEYPYGREVRGVKGGWVYSLQGRDYDFENGWIMNGIIDDAVIGTSRFTLE